MQRGVVYLLRCCGCSRMAEHAKSPLTEVVRPFKLSLDLLLCFESIRKPKFVASATSSSSDRQATAQHRSCYSCRVTPSCVQPKFLSSEGFLGLAASQFRGGQLERGGSTFPLTNTRLARLRSNRLGSFSFLRAELSTSFELSCSGS